LSRLAFIVCRFGRFLSESGFSGLTGKTGFVFFILPFLSILKILILTKAFWPFPPVAGFDNFCPKRLTKSLAGAACL
jgi:hypothetical protein